LGESENIDSIADKILEKLTGGKPVERKNSRGNKETRVPWSHQLASKKNIWFQLAIALGFSGLMTIGGWWIWVRDGIRDAASKEETRELFFKADKLNEKQTSVESRLNSLSSEQRILRETQIKQTEFLKNQNESFTDIKKNLEMIRRDQNRMMRKISE